MILEHNFYYNLCKELYKERESFKNNEKIFFEKMAKLKEEGVDVGDIFADKSCGQSIFESYSETEGVFYGKIDFIKPEMIPNLDFAKFSQGSYLSSASFSSNY